MLGIKSLNTSKFAMGTFLIVIAFLVVFLARNNAFPRQASFSLFHYLSGQETNYKTINFKQVQTEHYIIKYQPVDEPYVDLIGETAEEAYASVTGIFSYKPANKTTIVVYPDSADLAASFGWDKNEKALGVYWGGTIRILSPRAWLSGNDIKENFAKEGPMTHEFTHLLVDDITRGNYNRWWTEGMAQYIEKQTTGFEFADPFSATGEVKWYQFSVLDKKFDQLNQPIAYWQSLKAVEFIADHYGEDKLFVLLDCLGRGKSMDQAIQSTLGIDMQTFESSFMAGAGN